MTLWTALLLFPAPGAAQTPVKQTAANPAQTRYRRSSQRKPTMDRYKEIQQALIDRGYMAGPPDGMWGPDSSDAIKRFQRDQNLIEDGKLGALTLTALGLGPKRGGDAAATRPVKAEPVAADE